MREVPEFEVRQEADRLARRKVIAVAAGGVIVLVSSLWIAWGLLNLWSETGPFPAPLAAPTTIGTLEQTLIDDTQRGLDLRERQEAELRTWSWVDRDAGIVAMPIDRAMDLFAEHPIPIDRSLAPTAPTTTTNRPEPRPEGMAVSP